MNTLTPITHKRSTASAALRFLIHGVQPAGSGAAADSSGLGNNAIINGNTTDAAVWANPGWMTTAALDNTNTQGGGLTVGGSGASAAGGFNLYAEDSVVVCFTVSLAYPGFGAAFLGNSAGTPGINIGESSTNSGGLGVSIQDNSGNTYAAAVQAQFRVADGGAHKVVVLINGNNVKPAGVDTGARTMRIFADGAELSLANGGVFSAVVNSTLPSFGFGLGHQGNPSLAGTVGSRLRDVHLYVPPKGAFPASAAAVARWYAAKPDQAVPVAIMGY